MRAVANMVVRCGRRTICCTYCKTRIRRKTSTDGQSRNGRRILVCSKMTGQRVLLPKARYQKKARHFFYSFLFSCKKKSEDTGAHTKIRIRKTFVSNTSTIEGAFDRNGHHKSLKIIPLDHMYCLESLH